MPIYIQEKVQPRAIIENLRQSAATGSAEPELSLFDDFNGIEFEELVDFYRHEQNWSNRLILGDSLLVMTSLAEKEGLRGKVQTIFIDPPYGISFGSNWQVSTQEREVRDGKLDHVSRQPEQIRAFRDTWKDGIHSYLAYLRDRLTVARELLTGSGSVFVQIGDENVHLVRSLLDEVFGPENFISLITFRKTEWRDRGDFLPGRRRLHPVVRQGPRSARSTVRSTARRRSAAWAAVSTTATRVPASPAETRRPLTIRRSSGDPLDNLTSQSAARRTELARRRVRESRRDVPG